MYLFIDWFKGTTQIHKKKNSVTDYSYTGYKYRSIPPQVFSVLRSDDEKKNSRFLEVFPRKTKCDFYKYGNTGSVVKDDAFCILPQNIINEKIFLIMWIWFIVLTIITCLQVLDKRIISLSFLEFFLNLGILFYNAFSTWIIKLTLCSSFSSSFSFVFS